ncbi:MAG: M48 family metallopeptidase [Candidatus Izimaplasma sp.]|nr:M48 family metallopeptidase [Candidatus Izimaplasma bacterium]
MNKIILDNYSINYQVFFKKNKHMYLRIENGEIIITCNQKVKIKAIEKFIYSKKTWILKHIKKEPMYLYNLENMCLWGEKFPVKINEKQKKYLEYKDNTFILNTNLIKKDLIEKFYKKCVLDKIEELLYRNNLFINIGIDINNIEVKSQLMKTRFGSCIKQKRIIKLNSILARFDPKYIEMVLSHELVHLIVNNHSKSFYIELKKLFPRYKDVSKELKKLMKNIYH